MPTRAPIFRLHPTIDRRERDREYDKRRRYSPHRRLYNSQWRKASKRFIAIDPWCSECRKAGRRTPARETDHVVPHNGDRDVFWDRVCLACGTEKGFGEPCEACGQPTNLDRKCSPCHSAKTRREG